MVAPWCVGNLVTERAEGGTAHHMVDLEDAVPPLEGAAKGRSAREIGKHGAKTAGRVATGRVVEVAAHHYGMGTLLDVVVEREGLLVAEYGVMHDAACLVSSSFDLPRPLL